MREIIQLLRMKREEERQPTVKVEQEEDWDSEATNPPFYLQTNRTISFEQWAVRCPACGLVSQDQALMVLYLKTKHDIFV